MHLGSTDNVHGGSFHIYWKKPFSILKKVDSLALTKMSTALSSWKNRMKEKIEAGESWEKQPLTFTGFSLQDTPPEAGNPAQVKPTTVFSPNTLRKTIVG